MWSWKIFGLPSSHVLSGWFLWQKCQWLSVWGWSSMAVSGMVSTDFHTCSPCTMLTRLRPHVCRGNPRPTELLLLVHTIHERTVWTEVMEGCCCCISEVYGLLFLDGLASYSIPEGGTIAAPGFPIVYLNDSTYDGYQERRWEKLSCSLSVTVQMISSFLLNLSLVSCIPNTSLRPPELQANLLVLQSIVALLFQALWHIVSCFFKGGHGLKMHQIHFPQLAKAGRKEIFMLLEVVASL